MKSTYLLSVLFAFSILLLSCNKKDAAQPDQKLYFPPANSATWETLSLQDLKWNEAAIPALYDFLDQNNTRAFILLKDGKIVLEHYNGNAASGAKFSASSNWYWASAGKTIKAFLVGVAQQEGHLKLSDKSSDYLGNGWTSLQPAQESKITVWHHLTMTTGLDDNVQNENCLTPACLTYKAEPGTRWAYHNAPYTLLRDVIAGATNQSFNLYFDSKLKTKIGMDGTWTTFDGNHVYVSTPRAMARFGLLILNKGQWGEEAILSDATYFHNMTSTSQSLNQAYGYLWWLNGKSSFMIPNLQQIFTGSLAPDAPADMIAALGKNGQFINVVPSQNLVMIRMGEAPDNSEVPVIFLNDLWKKINLIFE